MATSGVFGTPIDEKYLRQLPEHMDKSIISQADLAKVAFDLQNVEGKLADLLKFLQNLVKLFCGGIMAVCVVYNSTGSDLTYVMSHNWHGHLFTKPYPLIIKNGQWAGWLHGMSDRPFPIGQLFPPGRLGAGVVYRGKNLEGKPKDWLQSWDVPCGDNQVHAEARDAGYYKKVDWAHLHKLLTPAKSEEVKDGCISEASITTGQFPLYRGLMGVTRC